MGFARSVIRVIRGVGVAAGVGAAGFGLAVSASAQVTTSTFTYQGRLEQDGTPYSGPATVRIGIYPSATAFSPIKLSEAVDVDVVDGLFVFDADVGTTAFELPGRFYQIDVRTPGMQEFVSLDRAGVRAAPVAALAHRAASLDRLNSTAEPATAIVALQTTGNVAQVGNRHWQQFSVGNSAIALRLVVQTRTPSDGTAGTLRIYQGSTPQTGELLSSQRVFLPPNGEAVLDLVPGIPVGVANGETYCWDLEADTAIGLVHAGSDVQPARASSLGASDYVFQVLAGTNPTMALGARRFGVNEGDPQAGLHVFSEDLNVARISSKSNLGAALQIESRNGSYLYNVRVFGVNGGVPGSTGQLGIERSGAASFVRFTDAGLSVNTASTSGALTVSSTSNQVGFFDSPSVLGTKVSLRNSGADGLTWDLISTGTSSFFGPGNLVIGNPSPGLVISRTGRVGVATSPTAMFHVEGGGNLSQAQAGFIQAGANTATNLSLDTNEIQVLNNGAAASLFLNFRGGQVFVGDTANPIGGNALQVNGNALKPGGGFWGALSDARAKKNIQPLHGTLDRVLLLHGYTFEYTDEAMAQGGALRGTQVGLLAQEVQKVFPDWVYEDDKGRLNVSERGITALMVESLRDLRNEADAGDAELREAIASENARLQREIDAATARVRDVERENQELRERLERIERAMGAQ